jgi:hypothetical protein
MVNPVDEKAFREFERAAHDRIANSYHSFIGCRAQMPSGREPWEASHGHLHCCARKRAKYSNGSARHLNAWQMPI